MDNPESADEVRNLLGSVEFPNAQITEREREKENTLREMVVPLKAVIKKEDEV